MERFPSFRRLLLLWEPRNRPRRGEKQPLIQKGGASHLGVGLSWGEWLLKQLLVFTNLLFSALGVATLGLGLWGLVSKESFAQEKIGGIGSDPMLLLVGVGVAVGVVSLTGCVGALRENLTLLRLFWGVVLLLLLLQVVGVAALYGFQDWLADSMRRGMMTAMVRYQDDLDLRFLADELQTGLQCCGADTYRDWEVNVYFNCSAPGLQACGVPPSCCVDPLENGTVWNSQCGVGGLSLDQFSAQSVLFLGGCLGSVARWLERHGRGVGVTLVLLLGLQLLALFITARLIHHIKRHARLQPR